jgi:hypothetical protein
MSTLAVVEEVLREANQPLSVREIVERAGPSLPTRSKTPDTVVARDLSMDLKRKTEASLFIRTSPGRYTLRSLVSQVADTSVPATAEMAQPASMAQPPVASVGQAPVMMSQALGTERAGTRPAAPVAAAPDVKNSSLSA